MVKAQQPGDDVLNNAADDDVNNAADDDLNSASDNNMKNAAARIQCAETPSLQPLFDVTKKEFAIDVTQTEFAKTVVILMTALPKLRMAKSVNERRSNSYTHKQQRGLRWRSTHMVPSKFGKQADRRGLR